MSASSGVLVSDALELLQTAFDRLDKAPGREAWIGLEGALQPFKHPLEGGLFSMEELDAAYDHILASNATRRTFKLTEQKVTAVNAVAINVARAVVQRITDCIECVVEVHRSCRTECESPVASTTSPRLK